MRTENDQRTLLFNARRQFTREDVLKCLDTENFNWLNPLDRSQVLSCLSDETYDEQAWDDYRYYDTMVRETIMDVCEELLKKD